MSAYADFSSIFGNVTLYVTIMYVRNFSDLHYREAKVRKKADQVFYFHSTENARSHQVEIIRLTDN